MKKYQVDLAYTGYVSEIVEAETEEETIDKVEQMGTAGISSFDRWPDADMIEGYPAEPEEGDYIISPCGPLGSMTRVSVVGDSHSPWEFAGENQESNLWTYIIERMKGENFYPNVWKMSDHGNPETVDIRKKEEA
jgi:hypothetical protein